MLRKIINKLYYKGSSYQVWAGAHGIVGFQGKRISFGWDKCLIDCGKLGFWFTIEEA